jgi:hypothetical protein
MAYTSDNIVSPGSPPVLWSDIDTAFRIINQNFVELYATIGGGSVVDFNSLSTNVSPSSSEVYDLGSSTKRWRDLYLSGSSLYLGEAVITSSGETINLPVGSTIGGLRVDENYFKFISVAGQDNIEADDGTDTLNFANGNGINITTNSTSDTVTISNTGVLSANSGTGISVSSTVGDIVITNIGVTRAEAGLGISLDNNTNTVEISNTGIVGINPGIGISVSARDPVTGFINIVNTQPNVPQQTFGVIAVPTQTSIAADSTSDTLTIQTSGDGLSITTTPLTDTLTFTNTGVTSLAVGNGLTIDAGTGGINLTLDATLTRNIVGTVVGDVTGSVFADDSTLLVDATEGLIVGNVNNSEITTDFVYFRNTGYQLFSDEGGDFYIYGSNTDSDIIIRTNASGGGQEDFVFGKDGDLTVPTGATITPQVITSGTPEDFTIRGQETSGGSLSEGGNLYIDGGEGNAGEGYANGGLWLGTESALVRIGNLSGGTIVEFDGYMRLLPGSELDFQGASTLTNLSSITTDLIGSVFADDSTLLVDATEGKIVGPIETTTGVFTGGITGNLTGDVIGSIFADDSTLLVDATNGEIPGYVKIADLKTALQDGAGDYAAFKTWVLANL